MFYYHSNLNNHINTRLLHHHHHCNIDSLYSRSSSEQIAQNMTKTIQKQIKNITITAFTILIIFLACSLTLHRPTSSHSSLVVIQSNQCRKYSFSIKIIITTQTNIIMLTFTIQTIIDNTQNIHPSSKPLQ